MIRTTGYKYLAKRRDGRRGEDEDEEVSIIDYSYSEPEKNPIQRAVRSLVTSMMHSLPPERETFDQRALCWGSHQAREPCARSFMNTIEF